MGGYANNSADIWVWIMHFIIKSRAWTLVGHFVYNIMTDEICPQQSQSSSTAVHSLTRWPAVPQSCHAAFTVFDLCLFLWQHQCLMYWKGFVLIIDTCIYLKAMKTMYLCWFTWFPFSKVVFILPQIIYFIWSAAGLYKEITQLLNIS